MSVFLRAAMIAMFLAGSVFAQQAENGKARPQTTPTASQDGSSVQTTAPEPQSQSSPVSSATNSDPQSQDNASPANQGDNSNSPQQNQSQSPQSEHERAEQELKQQERQRIMGVIPNFNTTDVQNAAPLSTRQKFRLAFRGALDPFQVVAAGLVAGIGQAQDSFPAYGQGAEGYAKRFGAAYADAFSGAIWGNAVFPSLLHQDPRYFRKGEGYSFKRRLVYSIYTAVWTKNDNGKWGPNYSNVLGNIAAGGLSNLYYPSADRGVGLTFERAFVVTAEGVAGSIFVEFWPDISRKFSGHHEKAKPAPTPAPAPPHE